jgi:hypothetical protein
MDVPLSARWALAHERRTDMTDLRRCIGSTKFGIEAHAAPVGEFPVQPSRKDGLGRMCKPHWKEYTTALRKAAVAHTASAGAAVEAGADREAKLVPGAVPEAARGTKPEPIRTKAPRTARRTTGTTVPTAGSQGDAG